MGAISQSPGLLIVAAALVFLAVGVVIIIVERVMAHGYSLGVQLGPGKSVSLAPPTSSTPGGVPGRIAEEPGASGDVR